jgi:predicted nuclease of predicted toxin-antitoxin system
MRILVDENIPNITIRELRVIGHDVLDLRGTERQGMFDDELWAFAQTEQRMVVTTDKGFAQHRDEQHCGILVVRLRQPNEQRIHSRIMAAFRQFTEHDWPGLLVVMRDAVQSVHRA